MAAEKDGTTSEILVGFPRSSPREGYVRFYASRAYRDFIEVRQADVIASHALDGGSDDSPDIAEIKGSAEIDFVRANRQAGTASSVFEDLRGQYPEISDALEIDKVMTLDACTTVYPCGLKITPDLYCTSDVFPPCPH